MKGGYLKGFFLLLRWQYLRQRQLVPLLAAVQVFLAVGVVYGLSYLIPHIDPSTALYLTTGAPTLTLILIGLSVVPGEVTVSRLSGHYEYVAALPVGRLAPPLAEVAFWLLSALPGMVISLLVAALRFHLHLNISPVIVPAVLLVALTASAAGYTLAAVLKPQIVQQLTSFLSVLLLLFSPINFPISRLPGWLQAVQRGLPIKYMADLIRYSLTGRLASGLGLTLAVLGVWCAGSLALTARVSLRRQ